MNVDERLSQRPGGGLSSWASQSHPCLCDPGSADTLQPHESGLVLDPEEPGPPGPAGEQEAPPWLSGTRAPV